MHDAARPAFLGIVGGAVDEVVEIGADMILQIASDPGNIPDAGNVMIRQIPPRTNAGGQQQMWGCNGASAQHDFDIRRCLPSCAV